MGEFVEPMGVRFRVWDNEKKRMFYGGGIKDNSIDEYLVTTGGIVCRMEGTRKSENEYQISVRQAPHAIAMPFITNLNYSPLYSFDIIRYENITAVVIAVGGFVSEQVLLDVMLIPIAKNELEFNKKNIKLVVSANEPELTTKRKPKPSFWRKAEIIGNIFENRDLTTPFIMNILRDTIDIDWENVYD
jgi:hypothetical protein